MKIKDAAEVATLTHSMIQWWETGQGQRSYERIGTGMDRLAAASLYLSVAAMEQIDRQVDFTDWMGVFAYDYCGEGQSLSTFLLEAMTDDEWFELAENNRLPDLFQGRIARWAVTEKLPLKVLPWND